jgi:murein DD-endopeptidase MepM/ murein hydrolase activator NlpD
MSDDGNERPPERGYGNIYTPHAGAMIIHVQRESGLANRTIILSQRQVKLLRYLGYTVATVLAFGASSWFYLAAQAARVPLLSRRVSHLQHDVRRLDTLQLALSELEGRYQQVQQMLGAPSRGAPPKTIPTTPAADRTVPDESVTLPSEWPLPVSGTLLKAWSDTGADREPGIDLAVPAGTSIRASGAGLVVEVRDDARYGKLVRITHRDGYESIYANASDVRVAPGDRVAAGSAIGLTGGDARSLPAHLHFEVRRGGVDVDPSSLMNKGPAYGNFQQ